MTDNQMEKLKKDLKKRIFGGSIMLLGGFALIGSQIIDIVAPFSKLEEHNLDFMRGFQSGLIFGLMMVAVGIMIYYAYALRHEETLKRIFARENDERIKAILDKSGQKPMMIGIILIIFASVVAGYFSMTVFLTLLSTAYFLLMLLLGFKIYFSTKF